MELKKDNIYYITKDIVEKYELFDQEIIDQMFEFTDYPFFLLANIRKYKTKKIYEWKYMPLKDMFYDFCEHEVGSKKIEEYENIWKIANDRMIEEVMLEKMIKMRFDIQRRMIDIEERQN